jgi:hypothetical protein
MDGSLQPRDPSGLRISDADRHKVAEVLREAAGDGRIDLVELDERLEAAYSAKTYGELVPITADLPVQRADQRPAAPQRTVPVTGLASYTSSMAIMSECSRRGAWMVPAQHSAFAMMGQVILDLREAHFATREVTITANAIMASVDIVVNAGTAVVVHGVGIMGEFSESRSRVTPELDPGSPVVHVRGVALMGAVNVRRKGAPWLRGRR